MSHESTQFGLRLHSVPLKAMSGREFRVAVYASRTAKQPISMSKPFRIVTHKVVAIQNPGYSRLAPPDAEKGLMPYTMKIALSAAGASYPGTFRGRVILDLSVVDQSGVPRPELVQGFSDGKPWWHIECNDVVIDNSDYTSLPVVIKCYLVEPVLEQISIRVTVESVGGGDMTPADIGSCDIPLSAKCSGPSSTDPFVYGSPAEFSDDMIESESQSSISEAVASNKVSSETFQKGTASNEDVLVGFPPEFLGNTPKQRLLRWIHTAMFALHKTKTTTDFDKFDREVIYEALSTYHLMGIEECINSLEELVHIVDGKPTSLINSLPTTQAP